MADISAEKIDHVAIDVTDVDRSRAFYGGTLGLREIARPISFTFDGAWYEIGSDVLHIVSRADGFPEAPHHFCLWVRDVYEVAALLDLAGYPVVWDTRYKIPGVDRFFTRDPDGNRVEFQGSDRTNPSSIEKSKM